VVNNNESTRAINPQLRIPRLPLYGRTAAQVQIGGGLSLLPGGVGQPPTYFYHWNSYQFYDDGFLTKGTHTLNSAV